MASLYARLTCQRLLPIAVVLLASFRSAEGAVLPDHVHLVPENELVKRTHSQDVQNCELALIALAASSFCSSFAHITDTTSTVTTTQRAVSTVVTVTASCTSTVTKPPSTTSVTSTSTKPYVTQTKTIPASTETEFVTVPGPTSTTVLVLPGATIQETITVSGPTETSTVTFPASTDTVTEGTTVTETVTEEDDELATAYVPAQTPPARKREIPHDIVGRATTSSTATCTIQGIPTQIKGFLCDAISEACSSFVHAKTVQRMTTAPVSTVRSTNTKSAQCVTTTVSASTLTKTSSVTVSAPTTTVSQTLSESFATSTLISAAVTITNTFQLPDVTVDITATSPTVTVTTSYQPPDETETVTTTDTETVTTTSTSYVGTFTVCATSGGVFIEAEPGTASRFIRLGGATGAVAPNGVRTYIYTVSLIPGTYPDQFMSFFPSGDGTLVGCIPQPANGRVPMLYHPAVRPNAQAGSIYLLATDAYDSYIASGQYEPAYFSPVAGGSADVVQVSTQSQGPVSIYQCLEPNGNDQFSNLNQVQFSNSNPATIATECTNKIRALLQFTEDPF